MEWIGTVVAIVVVTALIGAIVAGRILALKKGKSICGGDCGSCHGGCSHSMNSNGASEDADALSENASVPSQGNLYEIILGIDGMMCGMCEAHVCNAIREQHKVKKVKASYHKGIAQIIAPLAIMEEELIKTIEPTGYRIVSYELRKL